MIISKLEKIKETKNRLKETINAMGGTITDSTPFSEYPDKMSEIGEPQTAKEYYKKNRPKTWPYFPLPSEMTEEDDVIYLLYDATGDNCLIGINIRYTKCTCTIQKYMDTELISSETASLNNYGRTYFQYDNTQADYSTYNYIVFKLQGTITGLYTVEPMYNGELIGIYNIGWQLEISGKCKSCSTLSSEYEGAVLKYISFKGFSNDLGIHCPQLLAIPEIDTSNVTGASYMFNSPTLLYIDEIDCTNLKNVFYMFNNCNSLKKVTLKNTYNIQEISNMFYECWDLSEVNGLDFTSVTNIYNLFYMCHSLKNVSFTNTQNVQSIDKLFWYCNFTNNINGFDFSSVTTATDVFYACMRMKNVDLLNLKVSLDISSTKSFTREELINMLNDLSVVETTQTLTIGKNNLFKLTDADKLIATEKGWTLA